MSRVGHQLSELSIRMRVGAGELELACSRRRSFIMRRRARSAKLFGLALQPAPGALEPFESHLEKAADGCQLFGISLADE